MDEKTIGDGLMYQKVDVFRTFTVMLLIYLSFINQAMFITIEPSPENYDLIVDKSEMVLMYGEGCTQDIVMVLDYLNVEDDDILLRWESDGVGVEICAYDVDVVVTTETSWLVNFTMVVDKHKIFENVFVLQPSSDTSQITISEFSYVATNRIATNIVVIIDFQTI